MSIFQGPSDMKSFYKTNPVSMVMMIIITIIYVTQVILSASGISLIQLGGIKTWEYQLLPPNKFVILGLNIEFYRLITAIFLHGNFLHFLFNTFFGLFIIGAALERLIGSKKYAITLAVAGLGSSAVVYGWNYLNWSVFENQTAVFSTTIGASGAIFGAMGFLFYLTMVRPSWFTMQDISSIRGLILINVIFSFFGNISTSGHFGGLLMGLLVGLVLTSEHPHHRNKTLQSPYDRYNQENWTIEDFDIDDVFGEIVDDDDDDEDRRVW